MNTITLPTNLTCQGCVASIKPFFDESPKIKDWKVDLSGPVKTVTVTGEHIGKNDVVSLLKQAGYDILNIASTPSTALPPIGNTTTSFWGDTDKWKRASFNTLNCLLGCSLGDFSAVVIMQGFFPGTSMSAQMLIAIVCGLATSISLETVLLRRRESFTWHQAITTAFSMSFISMIAMEGAMNTSDFLITGGKSHFTTPQVLDCIWHCCCGGFSNSTALQLL